MVVYTRLVIVVGVSGEMEGSISYIVVSTRETNIPCFVKIGPPVPKKIFEHLWAYPGGHVVCGNE